MYIIGSVEKKCLTVIRSQLLELHPEFNTKEFDQELVRNCFRALFRRTINLAVGCRNKLIKSDPPLQIPNIKRIDENKIRAIIHGLDGGAIRSALLRLHL